jgi:hypothetical protein
LEPLLIQATSLSDTALHRQAISVEVQNGTNVNGLDGLAANRLNYAGYATHISQADAQNHQTSVLVDASDSRTCSCGPSRRAWIGRRDPFHPDPAASTKYRLIVGDDYQACFRPEDLEH